MSQELQSLNERIAERVGKELVDLIPEDQWQEIVNNEIANFKRETLPKMLKAALADAFKESVQAEVQKLATGNEYNQITGTYTNSALKQFIGDSGGEIFAAVLSPAMTQVMQQLLSQLHGQGNPYGHY